jgi:hypothetical protein
MDRNWYIQKDIDLVMTLLLAEMVPMMVMSGIFAVLPL